MKQLLPYKMLVLTDAKKITVNQTTEKWTERRQKSSLGLFRRQTWRSSGFSLLSLSKNLGRNFANEVKQDLPQALCIGVRRSEKVCHVAFHLWSWKFPFKKRTVKKNTNEMLLHYYLPWGKNDVGPMDAQHVSLSTHGLLRAPSMVS